MQAVPKVGNKHHFFDDGKISESRHSIAEVIRVIKPEEAKEITFNLTEYDDWDPITHNYNIVKPVSKTLYEVWREQVDAHRQSGNCIILIDGAKSEKGQPWCYAEDTDYFVECSIPNYDENTCWFVRHVNGGWFSMDIQNSWMSGRLMPIEFDWEEYQKGEDRLWEEWKEKHADNVKIV